jgi:hypothetical protein
MPAAKKTTTKTPKTQTAEKKNAPLVVEPHPKEYAGFPFITLIQYRKQPMLAIVDNVDDDTIKAFVLDLCGPEQVNEETIISIAAEWEAESKAQYPLSIEFSRRGLTPITSKIYRAMSLEFVSRVIGPVPRYPMDAVKSIKRRRRKPISNALVQSMSAAPLFEQLTK